MPSNLSPPARGSRDRTRTHVDPVAGARMLVVHPGALGDFVQSLPALAKLRHVWRAASLVLVTSPGLGALARDLALVDEVIPYDVGAAWRGAPVQRVAVFTSLVRAIRRARCTHAVLFKAAPAYAALAWVAGVPTRVGFARVGQSTGDRIARRLLTHAVPFTAGRHREDRFGDLIAVAGAGRGGPSPGRGESLCWRGSAAALSDAPPHALLVGMAPGGARNTKEDMAPRRWPARNYAELARRLVRSDPGLRVVLLGGPGDTNEADAVRAALPPDRVTDLVGRTSVADVRAVIARLSLFVTNDSGLLHLAATTSTPVVAVFGPSDPREACPRSACVRALWAPATDDPCLNDVTGRLRGCVTPCCIERVSVDAVTRASVDILTRLTHPPA